MLATAALSLNGGPIEVWRGSERIGKLSGHKKEILGVSWDATGAYLASWDSGLNVLLWDIRKPDKPIQTRQGYGFELGLHNNYWSFNLTCPCWSPQGKRLAIPTEKGVLIVSPAGRQSITIPIRKENLHVIWWHPNGQSLIVGKTIYDLAGKKLGKLGSANDNNNIPFLNWLSDDTLVTAWHRRVAIYGKTDQAPHVLTLPGFRFDNMSRVSMLSRGMNSRRVSPTKRYLIHTSSLTITRPQSLAGGDIYLIDLEKQKHLWTGIGYSDGAQIRIEPTGRVRTVPKEFDRYLTYVIRYANGRILPLTRRQFASRLNLSSAQQFVQQTLDLNGVVTVKGRDVPLIARDLLDSRDLPASKDVLGIDLSGNRYLTDAGLTHLGELASLQQLDLHGTTITGKGLSKLAALTQLRKLNLSGLKIADSVVTYLPDSIELLDVSHTDIGDFFLFDLKKMKSLKRLVLTGTKVKVGGIAALKKFLPDCEVVSDFPVE